MTNGFTGQRTHGFVAGLFAKAVGQKLPFGSHDGRPLVNAAAELCRLGTEGVSGDRPMIESVGLEVVEDRHWLGAGRDRFDVEGQRGAVMAPGGLILEHGPPLVGVARCRHHFPSSLQAYN